MNKLAKALYDNTAECADELAFRRGDILTVMDQNVAGTSGWWMCSLYGRHGLAPANRLKLLLQAGSSGHIAEKPKSEDSMQNIYQIPSMPRPTSSPSYEQMEMIYKVPFAPPSASKSPVSSALQLGTEGTKPPTVNMASSPNRELYDIPSQARQTSLITGTTIPRQMPRKYSLIPISELEKKFDPSETVYAVPPSLPQDPNYDIPVPSGAESHQKVTSGFRTLPNPHKTEWIYDVPVVPEKQGPVQRFYDSLQSKHVCEQLYDSLPAHRLDNKQENAPSLLYDTPKSGSLYVSSPPKVLPRTPLKSGPTQTQKEESVYAVPPVEEPCPPCDNKLLECKGDYSKNYDLKRVRLKRMRNFLACTTFHNLAEGVESVGQEGGGGVAPRLSAAESQRISTASSSSSSSCDSLALSSSSPEPQREVALSQDEACRKLLELQDAVGRAVPRLMEFVSSHWRCREHLEKHLKEIQEAAEGIACSVACFLNFALDIKGNTRRLTDANLQTRLYKQLSIVEDSGVILQQTVSDLNMAQWPLHTLCQDPGQIHMPDQLERFVMVARTIPEDIKRLASIVNANGKLLFRVLQKDPETLESMKTSPGTEEEVGSVADDNDYVELQTKEEAQKKPKDAVTPVPNSTQTENRCASSDSSSVPEESQSSPSPLSEHCRLYFGALQKAIGGFVHSLQDGQPPEKFISQSKLVIMVGQRLVDTLYREAQRRGSARTLLIKSNHLCALLKQLAVATKKAALHFPDRQALHEVQDFAKELAQQAQHFRISLDL